MLANPFACSRRANPARLGRIPSRPPTNTVSCRSLPVCAMCIRVRPEKDFLLDARQDDP
jgi:hypothetical protein